MIETLSLLYRDYIGVIVGIMENKMETTIMCYIGIIFGLYWGPKDGTYFGLFGCLGYCRMPTARDSELPKTRSR